MTIQKLAHSCIRLSKDGTTVLFDPGSFVDPAALGHADVVLLTHSHGDHYSLPHVRALAEGGAQIFAPQELTLVLIKEGVPAKALRPNSVFTFGTFSFQVLTGAHEAMPFPVPDNAPVLVDGRFLHPGDSQHVDAPTGLELVALPYAAPWGTMVSAVACAKRQKPQRVLPIHDGMYVESFRQGQTENLTKALAPLGIEVTSWTVELA